MRNELKPKTILQDKYQIKSLLSHAGTTSLVYTAYPLTDGGDTNPVIIKELYLANWFSLSRKEEETELHCEFWAKNMFAEELKNFFAQAEINNRVGFDSESNARHAAFPHMEMFEENGTGYIAISSVKGETLEKHLRNSFPEGVKSRTELLASIGLMKAVTNAVRVQHQGMYLNLDLKPDNVWVCTIDDCYVAHILDFGSSLPYGKVLEKDETELIAKRLSHSDTYSSDQLREVYHLRNEAVTYPDEETEKRLKEGLMRLSPADDVYSLCMIFSEMIFGEKYTDIHLLDEKADALIWLIEPEKSCLKEVFRTALQNNACCDGEGYRNALQKLEDVMERNGDWAETKWAKTVDERNCVIKAISESNAGIEKEQPAVSKFEKVDYEVKPTKVFAQTGKEGTIFKTLESETNVFSVDINYEKTRIREDIPAYGGPVWQTVPSIDISNLEYIQFDLCSRDGGIKTVVVECKRTGMMPHEVDPFDVTKEFQTFRIYTKNFQYPDILKDFYEIVFNVKPENFTDLDCLQGNLSIRNLIIR